MMPLRSSLEERGGRPGGSEKGTTSVVPPRNSGIGFITEGRSSNLNPGYGKRSDIPLLSPTAFVSTDFDECNPDA